MSRPILSVTVVKKLLDFGDDFIKKRLDVTTNPFWVDVLNHGYM